MALLNSKEEKLFSKKEIGKISVEQSITMKDFKKQVWEELVQPKKDELKEVSESIDQMGLRNPKNGDLGDVLPDNDE